MMAMKNNQLLGSPSIHYRLAQHPETGKVIATAVMLSTYGNYTFANEDCFNTEESAVAAARQRNPSKLLSPCCQVPLNVSFTFGDVDLDCSAEGCLNSWDHQGNINSWIDPDWVNPDA